MLLSDEARREMTACYRTPAQIQREIVNCGSMAALCAEKGQLAGLLYWQACADYLRTLANGRTTAADGTHRESPLTP